MVFTYMGAFVLSLAFEAPMLALEKIILKSDSSRQERDATSVSKHMEWLGAVLESISIYLLRRLLFNSLSY